MQGWKEQHLTVARPWQEDDAAPAPQPRPVTMPCPPGLDPEKWATLDRKTRRELWRHHRKLHRK